MLSYEELDKLNKNDIINYALRMSDFHGKFESLEKTLTDRFSALEKDFAEQLSNLQSVYGDKIEVLESEISVAKNTSAKLREELDSRFVELERVAYRTAEYVNYESIEVSKIPLTIPDHEVPIVVLKVVNEVKDPDLDDFALEDFHAIHRRNGRFIKDRVLMKFLRRGISIM